MRHPTHLVGAVVFTDADGARYDLTGNNIPPEVAEILARDEAELDLSFEPRVEVFTDEAFGDITIKREPDGGISLGQASYRPDGDPDMLCIDRDRVIAFVQAVAQLWAAK
jgi:hypothetical protein